MLTNQNLLSSRLTNQRLIQSDFSTAQQMVGTFGAVQAQEFRSAQWGIGLRIPNSTEKTIEKAFNQGKILRTHVLRPTWHFVHPRDIRNMLFLSAPRIRKIVGHYDRRLGITEKMIAESNRMIRKSLEKEPFQTRAALSEALAQQNMALKGQKLAHLIIHAELNGLICSGPKIEKQITYALLDERIPPAKPFDRNKALSTLANQFFQTHGPAQAKDFAWWSGLTLKDSQEAIQSLQPKLENKTLKEKTYWFFPNKQKQSIPTPLAFFLSIFDEYTIAYKDRSAISAENNLQKFLSMGAAFTSILVLNGKAAGTWKKTIQKENVSISLSSFQKFSFPEQEAIEKAAEQYGQFYDQTIQLSFTGRKKSQF